MKAPLPIFLMPKGISTFVNDEQSVNKLEAISSMEEGRYTSFSSRHPPNAPYPMFSMPSLILTTSRCSASENALD